MRGLCECGCGQRTRIAPQSNTGKSWIKGRPLRFVRGHANRSAPVEYIAEDRGFDTPCWIWQLSKNCRHGYGQINVSGRISRAHRVYYERHIGPIPDGLCLDHLCEQRDCVNPDHLEPVTQAENTRRAREGR